MKEPTFRKLANAEILNGDVLLFRRPPYSIISKLIATGGRGKHSHAAKVVYWDGVPHVVEMRAVFGGRVTRLEDQVSWRPSCIDVYRPNQTGRWVEYDRDGAARYMRSFVGRDYGWINLFLAALLHLPVIRLFLKASTEDAAIDKRPPFCSQAVACAERLGGNVDPVSNLPDRLTNPCDLARSPFYKYQFTLVP